MANEKIVNRENLKAFREKLQDKLENGQIVPRLAKNLSPVSLESGATQETPFILQGTGTANGSSIVDTADVGKHLEKQGNSVVVNQLAKNVQSGNYTKSSGSTLSFDNNIATFTSNAEYGWFGCDISTIVGHTYLIFAKIKLTTTTDKVYLAVQDNYLVNIKNTSLTTEWQFLIGKRTITTANQYNTFKISDQRTSNWDAIQIKECGFIDLTQMFNANIPQDLLDHPENFFRYYNGSLAYNVGSLENSDGRYLETNGRNVWDEQVEQGYINGNGTLDNSSGSLRSKNYTRCISNTKYYGFRNNHTMAIAWYDNQKNFIQRDTISDYFENSATSPSNACYFKISMYGYGTTYNNDITISLYYATGDGYDKYYPYEQPKVYDTGTEVLRKAGSVCDYKEPNGTIHRLVGSYTFTGEESWSDIGSGRYSCNVISSLVKIPSSTSSVANILIVGMTPAPSNNVESFENGIAIRSNAGISIHSSSVASVSQAQTFMSGKTIYFELATQTTEQGTPFAENIEINDYGTMGWLDTNNAYVDIPQGCKIFYPADMALFIDSLGQRTDIEWDASKIVSHTELSTQLGNYYNKTESDSLLSGKQDTLVSGTNIKSINNTSLLGSGNIDYDNALSDSSTNAVQNKVLKGQLDSINTRLAVLEESIISDDSLQYTYLSDSAIPSSANTYPIIESAGMDNTNIKGNSVVWNEQVTNGNFESASCWTSTYTSTSVSSNTMSITISEDNVNARISSAVSGWIVGHKYLLSCKIKTPYTQPVVIGMGNRTINIVNSGTIVANSWNSVYGIATASSDNSTSEIRIFPITATGTYSANDIVYVQNVFAIDLTQMFPTDTPTTTDDTRVQWAIQYALDNPSYNAGNVLNSKPIALISKSFNIFDEQWEVGGYVSATGEKDNTTNKIRSKNKIRVIPNTNYYACNKSGRGYFTLFLYDNSNNYIGYISSTSQGDKQFTTPNNAYYMAFQETSEYGTTYKNDICINISNATLNGTYRTYKAPISYPLSLPIMRSAGSVQDDNKKVRVGVVDLGTLNWTKTGSGNMLTVISDMKPSSYATQICLCSKYAYNNTSEATDKTYWNNVGSDLYIRDTSYTDAATFKTAMSGVMLNYELATPTDQPAITLPENIEFEKGGSLEVAYDSTAPTPSDFDFEVAVYKPIQ